MKVLTYGEIMDGGSSVFHSVAKVDDAHLVHTFEGVIRVDNPYRSLKGHLDELTAKLPEHEVSDVVIDFSELRFCNSNGFYVIMDIVEAIYRGAGSAPVVVRRIEDDDWQQETLPILLNIDEEAVARRTKFENVREP
jgi:hypothetical protein